MNRSEMEARLSDTVRTLVGDQVIRSANVEPVFGEEFDPDLQSIFTVDFVGSSERLLAELNGLRSVEYAHIAPPKRAVARG